MCKRIAVLCLGLAAVAAAWNATRLVAASERVRDAWITSQRKQTLEDWEIHFNRQMRQMQEQVEQLDRKARKEALAAELATMKAERLATRVERGKQLVAQFGEQAAKGDETVSEGFVFAGQVYDKALAGVQLRRFQAELEALSRQADAAQTRVSTHTRAAEQYRKAADALRVRVADLQQRGRKLALRRQLLSTKRQLRELERREIRCGHDAPLRQLDRLIEVAEESLDEVEAHQRIEQKRRPAKTLSLDEGMGQVPF